MTTENKRCVNLDWLEVDVLEPHYGLDPDYFRAQGFIVEEREYGTRVYEQMFTLYGTDGYPLLEVRRKPKTPLLSPQDVHLRLVNRTCYYDNAADIMDEFIRRYDYMFIRLTRVDICLDFEKFDRGDDPKAFLLRYLAGKYSKINQSNIHGHGTDQWNGRDWNSISWGSPQSDIGTKMYDKTLELYDQTTHAWKKPYIRQAWKECGLVDDWMKCTKHDKDGKEYQPRIWRVEFSIRSSVRNWFLIQRDGRAKNKQSIRNDLEMYKGRDKLLTMFATLSLHYFRFKHYEPDVRKDRCKDKILFDWKEEQAVYKVEKMATDRKPQKPLLSLLGRIRDYRDSHHQPTIASACDIIIRAIEDEEQRIEAGAMFTPEEIQALRIAVNYKSAGANTDVTILLRNIKALLKLNDKTAPF